MTRQQVNKFLEGVARGWSVSRACRSANVPLDAPANLRRRDAGFADAWALAQDAGTDKFEDAATDRALNGTTKGVWHQGQLVGYEIRYSDRLLLSVLAARRPSKWRHHDVLGEGGEGAAPSVRGEDVVALLEQKLAGLEARGTARIPAEELDRGVDS